MYWLIDSELFPDYRADLIAAIGRAGHTAVPYGSPAPPYRWSDAENSYRRLAPAGSCVVCHGDIEFVTRVGREKLWTPGVFATLERFHCSHYYTHFGSWLLNGTYVMLPFGELRRKKEFLFDVLGQGGRIFVRPDSPLKLFTGQTVGVDTFEADLEFLGFYEFPPESLVVVSPPQTVAAEWRFVVAGGRVVAGSLYKLDGKLETRPADDATARDLADEIAAGGFEPDPVWILDVGRTAAGEYRLLEIGGFSFSDLYATDKDAVVEAVSNAALRALESAGDRIR
jgi:hypothetical protein